MGNCIVWHIKEFLILAVPYTLCIYAIHIRYVYTLCKYIGYRMRWLKWTILKIFYVYQETKKNTHWINGCFSRGVWFGFSLRLSFFVIIMFHVRIFLVFIWIFLKNTFLNEKYCISNKKYLEFQVFVFKWKSFQILYLK